MSSPTFKQVQHLIKHRRSVFPQSYISREIPKEMLIALLDCANNAPSHKLTQPWHFVVFRNQGLARLGDQLAELYRTYTPEQQFLQKKYDSTKEKVLQSGAVIAIIVSYSGILPQWEELAATACAVENLWLAAAAAGIGGYWSTPGTRIHLGDFLKIKENQECLGFFYLGYHQDPPREALRESLDDKIRWEEQ